MLYRLLDKCIAHSRKNRGKSVARQRRPRCVLNFERLEARDLPALLTWAAGVSLPSPRGGVVAAVQGGDIMVFGGTTTDVTSLSASDPTWKATVGSEPATNTVRVSPGVGILPNGYVLLFGGRANGSADSSATEYDYAATPDGEMSVNTSVSPMNSSRVLFGSATDENHLIYAIGGIGSSSNGGDGGGGSDAPLSSVEYYTQSTDTWTSVASLPRTLYSEAAIGDGSGHLFTFGGVDATQGIDARRLAIDRRRQGGLRRPGIRGFVVALHAGGRAGRGPPAQDIDLAVGQHRGAVAHRDRHRGDRVPGVRGDGIPIDTRCDVPRRIDAAEGEQMP